MTPLVELEAPDPAAGLAFSRGVSLVGNELSPPVDDAWLSGDGALFFCTCAR
jgi:hypothetical protein